ncbi:MAG: hypothetical protein BM564_04605 [Bacteroidetes bacterium MedPE-SWsnd-G2]|nr:MAG: hypothetical protein BM564_04605 [Bacteroidetes bacterium MedPE-SWsnd-G2]
MLFCLCLQFHENGYGQKLKKEDSLSFYLSYLGNNNTYTLKQQSGFASKANQIAAASGSDSLNIDVKLKLSEFYESNADSLGKEFRAINFDNIPLAKRKKDTLSLAKIYFNLGDYYKKSGVSDSAYINYYESEKLYQSLKKKYELSIVLLNLAVIQKNEKDFLGSEITSVEGLKLLESLVENNNIRKYKSFFYNNLGLVFSHLEEFDEAIKYHNLALGVKRKMTGNTTRTINNSKNNLALSYKMAGKYEVAIDIYSEILEDKNLKLKRPDFYALVLDNYANALYLTNNYSQLPELYLEALHICEEKKYEYNSIIINQHLAEFYHGKKEKDSALHYAYKAKNISEKYHNDDLLNSLFLLAKIDDEHKAVEHYNAYIKLSDSLQKNERLIRNKFTRIEYETTKIEAENERITKERLYLVLLLIVLGVISLFVYIIIMQRTKNRELQFVQTQQENNEEIYNLMLSQQDTIDEARANEKIRISEELHDGILGRLFGTRLSLDSLNFSEGKEAVKNRITYINELKNIEQDIRKISHDLNTDFVSGSGFMDIVSEMIDKQSQAYGYKVEFYHTDDIHWDEVPNKTKINMFRILQELMQNIYKHAEASLVKISIELKNNVICLCVIDDGVGFEISRSKKGIGIKNITSRVEQIDAQLQLHSQIGKGTEIKIMVPYRK